MVIRLTATDLKARLLAVLDAVAAGDEVEVTKHGRTIARLVPARGPASSRGTLAGTARSVDDDELLFSTGAAWDLP